MRGAYRLLSTQDYEVLGEMHERVAHIEGFVPAPMGVEPDYPYAHDRTDYRETNFPHVSFFTEREERLMTATGVTAEQVVEAFHEHRKERMLLPATYSLTGYIHSTTSAYGKVMMASLQKKGTSLMRNREVVHSIVEDLAQRKMYLGTKYVPGVVIGRVVGKATVIRPQLQDVLKDFRERIHVREMIFTRDELLKGPPHLNRWLTERGYSIPEPSGQVEPEEQVVELQRVDYRTLELVQARVIKGVLTPTKIARKVLGVDIYEAQKVLERLAATGNVVWSEESQGYDLLQ